MTENEIQVNSESKDIVQKRKHNKENPYVMISKKMLNDKNLSAKAKGFLIQCLSLEGPHTSIDKISKQIGVSRGASYKICKELSESRYLIATHRITSKGMRKNTRQPVYVFFDHIPSQQEIDTELAEADQVLRLLEVE